MPDLGHSQLSPRLNEILDSLQDRAFSDRLWLVYLAAAQAIAKLSDMDLVKYETQNIPESPDLSLWEEMAPVIRDTVMDVNAMLSVIREQFPMNTPGGLADTVARAVDEIAGPFSGGGEPRRAQQAVRSLHTAMQQIASQVTELGEAMRSPNVVSDRWNLLAEIQRFRTRFREEIGELVYDTASAFVEVHRKDVVPGHSEDVAAAVLVRTTVADLTRVAEVRLQKIQEAEHEDVQWHAQQLEKELDMFGRTPAYQALRAQDKRAVIEFRLKLGKLAVRANPPKQELVGLVTPFGALIKSLGLVNKRQILVTHDREVLAGCGVRLEQAEKVMRKEPAAAARILAEAALSAQALYGRDPELDGFLRKGRKTSLAGLVGADLRQTLEQFRGLLASLML